MRWMIWGTSVVVGLAVLGAIVGGDRDAVQAQSEVERVVPSGDLIALIAQGGSDRQLVMVVDPKLRVMSVYHIDHESGAIALKSVRSIGADLMLDEFNTDSPLPREIRAMLTKR